jgi:hypothetical protein
MLGSSVMAMRCHTADNPLKTLRPDVAFHKPS